MTRIAVIGAGMAGLAAARRLSQFGDVVVFEKSRGPGGRMATRRGDGYGFDHGAQFFKARSVRFCSLVRQMRDAGVVDVWNASFAEIDGVERTQLRNWDKQFPHYVGVPGMNAVGKYLGSGLNILTGTRIAALKRQDYSWQVKDESGAVLGMFDWVILASPAAQARELVPTQARFFSRLSKSTCNPVLLSCWASKTD